MKKNLLLVMSAAMMLTIGISSCSSSDDDDVDKQQSAENKTDEPQSDCEASVSTDVYRIEYSLKNENGDRTTIFKEGENIVFDVTIHNTTQYKLSLADERDFLMGSMSVFSIDGEYVGNPFEEIFFTDELRWVPIDANSSLHWSCSWVYDDRYAHDDRYGSPLPYFKKCNTTFKPLPKGTYYSRLKGQILKHVYANDERGFDYIELKIPFIVK